MRRISGARISAPKYSVERSPDVMNDRSLTIESVPIRVRTSTLYSPRSVGVNAVLYSPSRVTDHSSGISVTVPDGAVTRATASALFTLRNVRSEISAFSSTGSPGDTWSPAAATITRDGTSLTNHLSNWRQKDSNVMSSSDIDG